MNKTFNVYLNEQFQKQFENSDEAIKFAEDIYALESKNDVPGDDTHYTYVEIAVCSDEEDNEVIWDSEHDYDPTEYTMFCPECGHIITDENSFYNDESDEMCYMCPECGVTLGLDQLDIVFNSEENSEEE